MEIQNQLNAYNFFQLYSCCIPVKGAARSTVCDLQRQDFIFIPNELYDLLNNDLRAVALPLSTSYPTEITGQLAELIGRVEEAEYGYYTNEPENFPNLSPGILNPSIVSNAIIDIDASVRFNLKGFIDELSRLLCQAVLIRVYSKIELSVIVTILKLFNHTSIRSIELILAYDDLLTEDFMIGSLIIPYGRCRRILVHSSPFDRLIQSTSYDIAYSTTRVTDESCCGNISPYYFNANYSFFFEARHSNSCLNRKISVDRHGYIKNCPSSKDNYGHYDQLDGIDRLLESSAIKDVWKINKDSIRICKDCEFRYICHDCRVFLSDESDPCSKPLKCKYDPYNAIWEN